MFRMNSTEMKENPVQKASMHRPDLIGFFLIPTLIQMHVTDILDSLPSNLQTQFTFLIRMMKFYSARKYDSLWENKVTE